MLNDYSRIPGPMPIGAGLWVKRSMCIGFGFFYSVSIFGVIMTQMKSEHVPFIAFPAGLFFYFFSWGIYKYRIGKAVVVGSNILFWLLILYFVITE
jgi:hypothetical protein